MAILSLLIMAIWTWLALRLAGVRATLRERTFATYLVLGALLGLILLPLSAKLLAPYGENGPWLTLMASMGRQGILVGMVTASLFASRVFRMTGVADVFLAGFAVGFGAELVGLVLAASDASQPLAGLSWIPPFQMRASEVVVPGYGYWTGLVCLALAAVLRFGRDWEFPVHSPWLRRFLNPAAVVAGIVFLWGAAEQAALWRTDGWLQVVGTLTVHGRITGWLALIALIVLSVVEWRWVLETLQRQSMAPKSTPAAEWEQLFGALVRGRFGDFARLHARFALGRQVDLGAAELTYNSRDSGLAELQQGLEARLGRADGRVEVGLPPHGSPADMPGPRGYAWPMAAGVVLAILLLLVPRLPDAVREAVWALPLWRAQLGGRPILALLLMGLLVWRFLIAAPRPAHRDDLDDVAQFRTEAAMLHVAVSLVLLSLFYGRIDELYASVLSLPASVINEDLLSLNQLQALMVMLIAAIAATELIARRTLVWQRAQFEERRAAVLRNLLILANAALLVWFSLAVYVPTLTLLHQRFGALLFDLFGTGGNIAAAFMIITLTLLLSLGVAALLRSVSERVARFFLGETLA